MKRKKGARALSNAVICRNFARRPNRCVHFLRLTKVYKLVLLRNNPPERKKRAAIGGKSRLPPSRKKQKKESHALGQKFLCSTAGASPRYVTTTMFVALACSQYIGLAFSTCTKGLFWGPLRTPMEEKGGVSIQDTQVPLQRRRRQLFPLFFPLETGKGDSRGRAQFCFLSPG